MFKMSSYFFEKFGNKKKPPSSVLLQVKMKKKPPSLICFRENWPENQRINFMWPYTYFTFPAWECVYVSFAITIL